MAYAIDTIVRLVEENTRLKCGLPPTLNTDEVVLVVNEKEKNRGNGDDYDMLFEMEVETICDFLATEHSYHLYKKGGKGEPPTAIELDKLKESADLIAESQQKQINLLLEDKRERMEDRERLVKRIARLEEELAECGVHIHEDGSKAKINGRGRPKKTECSPCIADPSS
jgi:hypothetical protein